MITGRFSRRLILAGIASLPAIAGATATWPAPLALLISPPTRESARAKLGRLEALLDTLPPHIAAAYRAQMHEWLAHIVWMQESGAPRADILAYIRSMRYNDKVFAQFKASLSGTTL